MAMADEIAKIAPGIQFHPVDDTTEAGQALKLYEQATGKRVALFTTTGPALDGSTTDGFALRDDPNTIYMAANTVQPFLHVLGHETSHTLEQMPGYQEFSTQLRAVEPEAWNKARGLFADEGQAAGTAVEPRNVQKLRFVRRQHMGKNQGSVVPAGIGNQKRRCGGSDDSRFPD